MMASSPPIPPAALQRPAQIRSHQKERFRINTPLCNCTSNTGRLPAQSNLLIAHVQSSHWSESASPSSGCAANPHRK